MNTPVFRLPKLPVADWDAVLSGGRAPVPSVSELPHVHLTTSGRAAIFLALQALRIGAGDRVLVPTYHCPTMVSPVVALGANAIFFPIGDDGAPLRSWFDEANLTGVRAMLAAHYFGLPRDLSPARALCDRLGIALIEDCAHAFFGNTPGLPIGATGDFVTASLTKFFPVEEGGCIASTRRAIPDHLLRPRDRAASVRKLFDTVETAAKYGRFRPLTPLLRWAFAAKDRLRGRRTSHTDAEMQPGSHIAASTATPVLDVDLAQQRPAPVVRWIERHADRARIVDGRRRNYLLLAELLGTVRGGRAVTPDLPEGAVPYVFPFWVDHPERCYQPIRRSGVPVFCWDVLWPGVPTIPGDVGLTWSPHVLQIGCHQDLREEDIHAIADRVRTLVENPE